MDERWRLAGCPIDDADGQLQALAQIGLPPRKCFVAAALSKKAAISHGASALQALNGFS